MLCLPFSGPLPVATIGALAPALADFQPVYIFHCSRHGLHGPHDWDTLLGASTKIVGLWFGALWPGRLHIRSVPVRPVP